MHAVECAPGPNRSIQRSSSPTDRASLPAIPQELDARMAALCGAGEPLPRTVRALFEP